jgi:catechol 2,3-dioxygenase-like lactoylglutathione lyase family enzyme
MSTVTFGEHANLRVPPTEQDAVRKFFRDVLGVPQTRGTARSDIFKLGPHFYLGVIYDDNAPTKEAQLKSIWLELQAADPEAMKAKILAGGGREIEFWDKKHFYFQAPGGQVFRLISDAEDMSEWHR